MAYPEDETRQWKFIKGVFSQLRKDCPIFGILVIGETGTGKSTLINNLLGKEVAPVGHTMESETLRVTPHEVAVEGVPVVVYDTPGLNDTREGEDEKKYLDIMKSLLARKKIHLVIYCLKMTETRILRSLVRTFEEYHKIDVPWEQTVITITFADKEGDPSRFSQIQQHLKKTLVERVGVVQSTVEKMKICPTAKVPSEALPSGRPWYVPFWLDVVEVLVPAALVRFFDIHEGNIHMESMPTSSQPKFVNVTLTGEDKERYERQISRLSERLSKIPFSSLLSTPTLDELNQLVVWRVAAQWYEVGVFLEVGAGALDTIRTDNLHNVRQACRDMFNEWLSRGSGTGEQPRVWQSVLEAVRETVGEVVAREIEREALSQASSQLAANQDSYDNTLVQVIQIHAEEFLKRMNSKEIAPKLKAMELIPESTANSILLSKDKEEANTHLLTHLKENASETVMKETFRVASKKTGWGKMSTFAAFMLRELQGDR